MARSAPPQAIVIFGASGDLTARKLLPAFFHLFEQGRMPERFAIVGYARTEWDDDAFREHARASLEKHGPNPEGEVWDRFAERLHYVAGEFADPHVMDHLVGHLERIDRDFGTEGRYFFYAATPPVAYPDIVARIGEAGLAPSSKILIEKPFGRDLPSAMELNEKIHRVFDEHHVFRIDHYLGKETVQNILAFRFANGLFEPVWNRRHIDHVQITVAEDIGIEGRGKFYEQTGAIRDMVATHLFQTMTFLAMEPPVSLEPDRLRDETVKVLRATRTCMPRRVVRGQYEGYREEPGVSPDSQRETFAALEVGIENWRWADVPFFLRTGKRLAGKLSEITLKFRKVPFNVFKGAEIDTVPHRDHLTIRVQPDEGITLALNAKLPGHGLELGRVTMDFDYEERFTGRIADAYELILLSAMEGDQTLFLRQDGVERAWEVLDPILDHPGPVLTYPAGSWGPSQADQLLEPRRWHVSAEHRGTRGAGSADLPDG
jgi:glucose-6-phosphate 1-dehydrogenase